MEIFLYFTLKEMEAKTTNIQSSDNGDFALVKAAQKGETKALQTLVKKYEETVYRFSFKVCRNENDAQDTQQEAFLNILKSLKSFSFKSNFSTWIYRIVSNSCLMKFRKEKRDRMESFEEFDTMEDRVQETYKEWDYTPADQLLSEELKDQMDKAILALPPIYRLVFVLKDLEGLKIEEIAQSLEISVAATKARLRRARLFLRDKLEPYMV